jgi:single-strand DNA-binding protein
MSKDLNKVQLTGRLGKDPEVRNTPQGNIVTQFTVASNRSWRTADNQQRDDTEWFSVVAWNKLGEICGEYLRKGSRVYIEGRLQTRSWEDQESGQKRYKTEVIATDMIMLDSRRDAQGGGDYADADVGFEPEPEPVAPRAPVNRGFQSDTGSRSFGNDARRPAANGVAPNRQPARPSATMERPRRPALPANEPMDDEDLPF